MRLTAFLTTASLGLTLLACKMLGGDEGDGKGAAASAKAEASSAATPAEAAKAKGGVPTEMKLMPIAEGQFVEYRMKGGGKAERYGWAVIGKEDESFWLQMVSNMEGKDAVMHMLVDVKDATDINDAAPKKLKFKVPGRGVQEVSGAMLKMASKYKPTDGIMLKMDLAEMSKGPRKDVTVPAGTFKGTFGWSGTTKWRGKSNKTSFESHPDVPITGVVRGNDGTRTWELVKHGTSGAKSEL